MTHEDVERELHAIVSKHKMLYVPLNMRHDDDSILLPVGVVKLREGFKVIDGHIIHVSGVNESTWDKYGVGLYGEKIVMDLLRARSLEYGLELQNLRLSSLPMNGSQSLA